MSLNVLPIVLPNGPKFPLWFKNILNIKHFQPQCPQHLLCTWCPQCLLISPLVPSIFSRDPFLPKKKIPIQLGTCKGVFNVAFYTLPYNYCQLQFHHSLLFPPHLSSCSMFSRCVFVIDQTQVVSKPKQLGSPNFYQGQLYLKCLISQCPISKCLFRTLA